MPDHAGTWIVVIARVEGNERDGFDTCHYWDGYDFPGKEAAIGHGFNAEGHDDFNVALVKDGAIESLWWMDKQIGEEPHVLAEISREIGLRGRRA